MTGAAHLRNFVLFKATTVALATAFFVSACTLMPKISSDDADETTAEPTSNQELREPGEETALDQESRESAQKGGEKGAIGQAKPKSHPKSKPISKMAFEEDMQAVNERIDQLSERIGAVSDRLDNLALSIINMPAKLAEFEAALKKSQATVKRPRSITGAPTHSAGSSWGVQLAAYSTRSAAEEAWSRLLKTHPVPELVDSKVHYPLSKPLKDGKQLTLIVVNEYTNLAAANDACNLLKEVGVDCVPVQFDP